MENVINLSLPANYKSYVHRVGRTARAGKSGVAISLVSDNDRTLFTKIIKMNKKNKKAKALENRTVPSEVLNEYLETLKDFENDVKGILKQEQFEKTIQIAEVDLKKAEKKLTEKVEKKGDKKQQFAQEQKRGWFQKHHERSAKEQDKNAWLKGKGKKSKKNGKQSSFGKDLSDTSRKTVKNMRFEAGVKRKRR